MTLFELCSVFGVFIHAAMSSSNVDELKNTIAHVKNDTEHVELANDKLRAEIKDQRDRFESEFTNLKGVEESDDEELKNVTGQLNVIQLKLTTLYAIREMLVNISIPGQKRRLIAVEYGVKWLKEGLALLRKRSSDGDQLECFRVSEERSQRDDVTRRTQNRMRKVFDSYDDEIEILKLELSQAISALKKARRTNDQLNLKLSTDRAVFVETIDNLKSFIEDVEKDVEKAKTVFLKFEEKFAVVSKEVEELKEEYDDLEKREKALRAEAVEVKRDLDMYEKAVECYNKFERFAIDDDFLS